MNEATNENSFSSPSSTDAFAVDCNRAAAMFDISTSTWNRMSRSGKTPAPIRLGNSVRWRVDELREWAEKDCPNRQEWEEMKRAQ